MIEPSDLHAQAKAAQRLAEQGGAADTARVLAAIARMIAGEAGLAPAADPGPASPDRTA